MKIDSTYKPGPMGGGFLSTPRATSSPAIGDSAEVHFSAVAARLAAGDDSAPLDLTKVSEIKQAIANGTFKINAGAIADSLIATARELVDGKRSA